MQIKSAVFTSSAAKLSQCPAEGFPEYAFAGRSNVGKSSLINMLTGIRNLAKTSSDPGKTRLLNFFMINNEWYLVDIPGYGYARTARTQRQSWKQVIRDYLLNRKSLFFTFLLIDSRHLPMNSDLEFIEWLGSQGIPFCLVFTKADKVSGNELSKTVNEYKKRLNETWEELPPMFVTSARNKTGKDEILSFIAENNNKFSGLLKDL